MLLLIDTDFPMDQLEMAVLETCMSDEHGKVSVHLSNYPECQKLVIRGFLKVISPHWLDFPDRKVFAITPEGKAFMKFVENI